jgi:cathepsin D
VIVAPPDDAEAFWAQVPGAGRLPASSGGGGYYAYPCASPPQLAFVFPLAGGGSAGSAKPAVWRVAPQDMNLGRVSTGSTLCVGAVTGVDVGLGDATWILGDSFLKVLLFLSSSLFGGRSAKDGADFGGWGDGRTCTACLT